MSFNSIRFIFYVAALPFLSCHKSPSQPVSLKIQESAALVVGEKASLGITVQATEEIKSKLTWRSSDPQVASVTALGEVNALQEGNAAIVAAYGPLSDTCRVEVNGDNERMALNLAPLALPLSQVAVYSKNVLLIAPFRVMQCFGLDTHGNIYYAQLGQVAGNVQGQTKSHELYIIKGHPDEPAREDYMTLKYFGHGGNIAIEQEGPASYVWVNSNATKDPSSKEYEDSRSVSRIKYEAGKTFEGYGGDTYFLNKGLYNLQPAVDEKDSLLCLSATQNGARFFFTYNLYGAEKLPLSTFTFSVRVGGEDAGVPEQTVTRSVQGRDLSKLTPLGSFVLPKGADKTQVNSYSMQGFDIDGGRHIYFFEGDGNGNIASNGPSNAFITVFDLNGKVVRPRTRVMAISSITDLDQAGITNTGYMEAEGIKVKGNQLYIAFASRRNPADYDDYRRANIFLYQGKRK
jgi:hypothetical protein